MLELSTPDAPASAVRREGDLLVADLEAGQTLTLCLPGVPVDPGAAFNAVRASDAGRLGLR